MELNNRAGLAGVEASQPKVQSVPRRRSARGAENYQVKCKPSC